MRPFFYPHFGPAYLGYSDEEAALWEDQVRFMTHVADYYGAGMVEPIPFEGGGSFAEKYYPESWWWQNFGAEVMAVTLETPYGRAGYAPDWVTPDDYRGFGRNRFENM